MYTGYEVVLDVFPDVFAYGILLVPKDIKPGERRPVVVCQHGLEGRPTDVADPKKVNPAYNQFACRLAERGLHRLRAAESVHLRRPVPHAAAQGQPAGQDALLDHRAAAPADRRLAGRRCRRSIPSGSPSTACPTAARRRCACRRWSSATACRSARPTSTNGSGRTPRPESPYSYVTTGEYEIFEFDLGNTFNYAEMAALIAPRPFMVERGHRDGVAPDTWVAYEYAKVRLLYADLRIPERTDDRVLRRPAHDPRRGHVRVPAQAPELAGPVESLTIAARNLCRATT